MRVYVVLLKTKDLDHNSGSVDEFQDIVKIFLTPNKANDFLEGKPTKPVPVGRWYSVESYEVVE